MPRPRKSEEQITAMRERIVAAAFELLREEGPEALSIRAIAARVGVSHMVLYTYFRNRGALIAALRGWQRGRMQARQTENLRKAEAGDVREAMRDWLAFYARMARNLPRMYWLLWVLRVPTCESLVGLQEMLEGELQHLSSLIGLGIERGVFISRDPVLAAATVLTMVNGPLLLYYSGRLPDLALRDLVVHETVDAAMSYLCGDWAQPTEGGNGDEQLATRRS